ncbi:hypothetical protein N9P08_00425 [Alphaproteobacteria bacterium]|nr:hypothetical protein [Alphaproteobacteria bacterium]
MRSPVVINQAAAGSCRSLSWPWHYGALSMVVVMAVLFGRPDLAFAQYPGFSSDAEPASVTAGADNSPSGGSGNNASANSGAEVAEGDGDNDLQTASNRLAVAANRAKNARLSRKHYFVRKLRVEFAAMELVERRTGMAFSRHDVPRYLDELRDELAKMRGSVSPPVQSLADDVQHIDTKLNKHIDKLLTMIGTPTTGASSFPYGFFTPDPPLPKTPADAAAAKMASISLKYELMDYGEKALQAMGAGYR